MGLGHEGWVFEELVHRPCAHGLCEMFECWKAVGGAAGYRVDAPAVPVYCLQVCVEVDDEVRYVDFIHVVHSRVY
jgi:hypothetical protein